MRSRRRGGHGEASPGQPPAARRPGARPLWLVAAVLAAVVVAVVVRGLDADDDLSIDEQTAREPADAAQLTDPGRWTLHRDLDRVQAIAPAVDGGVWVATPAGLLRWDADGVEYRRYGVEPLDGRTVTSLVAPGDGRVWALTDTLADEPADPATRLLRFDGSEWTAVSVAGLPDEDITEIAADADGGVWAVADRGLARFHDGAWRAHTPFAGLGFIRETSFTVAANGVVWATASADDAFTNAVARFHDGAWRVWTTDDRLPDARIESLATGGGRAWMVLNDEDAQASNAAQPPPAYRLVSFDGRQWTTRDRGDGTVMERLDELVVDSQGNPWAVSARRSRLRGMRARRLVVRFDGTRWRPVAPVELPRGAVVSRLTAGPHGAVWASVSPARFGASGGRVVRFDGDGGTVYRSDHGLPRTTGAPEVTAGADTVWVASGNGAARFDGGDWTRFATDEGLAGDRVDDVVTHDGAVWAATAQGVSRLADGDWTTWTAADGLAATAVNSLAVGPDGAVWAGTSRGVSRFDGQAWTTGSDELDSGVASVSVGDGGTVWAVTLEPADDRRGPGVAVARGLARYRDGEWTTWTDDGPLAHLAPTDVAAGDHGGVWVAVAGDDHRSAGDGPRGGVAHFDGHSWQVATPDDGLPHEEITTVAVEDSGAVWVGTQLGLARFQGHRWVSENTAGDPLHLDEDDPVADREVSAIAFGGSETVWALTSQGLSRFDGRDWTNLPAAQLPTRPGNAIAVGRQAVWMASWQGLASVDRWRDPGVSGPRHSGHTSGISTVAVASTTTVSGAPSRAKSPKR